MPPGYSGIGSALNGFVYGLRQEDERKALVAERARLQAAAELKDRLTQERQERLDRRQLALDQADQADKDFNNNIRLQQQAVANTAAGFSQYRPGMIEAPTQAVSDAVGGAAGMPGVPRMMVGASDAIRLKGQHDAGSIAANQGGWIKTGMSDTERNQEENRRAQEEAQRASADLQRELLKLRQGFEAGENAKTRAAAKERINAQNTQVTGNDQPKPLTGTAAQRMEAIATVQQGLKDYKTLLDEIGPRAIIGHDDAIARLANQYGSLQMGLKEAFNLGVLNGPDLELIERQLTNPIGLKGLWRGKNAMLTEVDQTADQMRKREDTMRSIYQGQPISEDTANTPPAQNTPTTMRTPAPSPFSPYKTPVRSPARNPYRD